MLYVHQGIEQLQINEDTGFSCIISGLWLRDKWYTPIVEFYPDICFIKDHTLLHQFLQFKNGFGDAIGRGFWLRAIGLRQFMWIRKVLPAVDKTGDSRYRNFYSLFGKPVLELFRGGTFFVPLAKKFFLVWDQFTLKWRCRHKDSCQLLLVAGDKLIMSMERFKRRMKKKWQKNIISPLIEH